MKNQFYNRTSFRLVKIKFSECTNPYTYAAHKSYDVQVGDIVVVPVDNDDFNDVGSYQSMKVVRVCGITDDMRHIPQNYPLKHIIDKIEIDLHDRILKAKCKYLNAKSRKHTRRK